MARSQGSGVDITDETKNEQVNFTQLISYQKPDKQVSDPKRNEDKPVSPESRRKTSEFVQASKQFDHSNQNQKQLP